jgi:hypothetical protein
VSPACRKCIGYASMWCGFVAAVAFCMGGWSVRRPVRTTVRYCGTVSVFSWALRSMLNCAGEAFQSVLRLPGSSHNALLPRRTCFPFHPPLLVGHLDGCGLLAQIPPAQSGFVGNSSGWLCWCLFGPVKPPCLRSFLYSLRSFSVCPPFPSHRSAGLSDLDGAVSICVPTWVPQSGAVSTAAAALQSGAADGAAPNTACPPWQTLYFVSVMLEGAGERHLHVKLPGTQVRLCCCFALLSLL